MPGNFGDAPETITIDLMERVRHGAERTTMLEVSGWANEHCLSPTLTKRLKRVVSELFETQEEFLGQKVTLSVDDERVTVDIDPKGPSGSFRGPPKGTINFRPGGVVCSAERVESGGNGHNPDSVEFKEVVKSFQHVR